MVGHCHAWLALLSGEATPRYKIVRNTATGVQVRFRVRDRKGLMCEAYYNDTELVDFSIYQPSPGSRGLGSERKLKQGSHVGKKRGFVGELYYGDEVWNYPIYKYKVCVSGSFQRLLRHHDLWGLATVTGICPKY